MSNRSAIVLQAALGLFKPLARLMLRHGVVYPVFAAALKRVFLEAARDELRRDGRPLTDSAVSLLSGVHRRDVRNLTRLNTARTPVPAPMNMATQVVARWLSAPQHQDEQDEAQHLSRSDFDALVASVSSDIRPRTVLDELVHLGIAQETDAGVRLLDAGFTPRKGFAEMAHLLQENIRDHLAAASGNMDGDANFLEQSVFVDQLTAKSAHRLHVVSTKAWRQAFKTVMQEAAARFEHDQAHAKPEDRTHRARFGSYFYTEQEDPNASNAPPP